MVWPIHRSQARSLAKLMVFADQTHSELVPLIGTRCLFWLQFHEINKQDLQGQAIFINADMEYGQDEDVTLSKDEQWASDQESD
jgi:hypothetical protein